MYSVVLMAALTTSGEIPDFGRRGRGGCCGCSGGGYAGCSGGYGRYGCYGGGYGGCYGGGYGGCSGGGYGGYGGCYGGGYGGYGGYGGTRMRGYGYGSPYGGGYSYGAFTPYMIGSLAPATVIYTGQTPSTTQIASGPQPATFVVNLPADAKLKVEGAPTYSTSSRRVFVSPPLEPGRTYTYTLQAQVTRDGQTVSMTKEVPVRAGQQSEVTIDMPSATASASR